jgi:hypothetical protein
MGSVASSIAKDKSHMRFFVGSRQVDVLLEDGMVLREYADNMPFLLRPFKSVVFGLKLAKAGAKNEDTKL